jgi:hypothetical protein
MNERVYGVFSPIATWPAAALFFVAFVICTFGFQLEMGVLGPENQIPDVRGWYTPAEIRDLYEKLGEHKRNVYAATAMSLDVVFPLAYGGLFAALIAHVYRPRLARVFVCVPVLAVAADLVENSLLSYYAWNYDGKQWPLLIWGATTATALKFVFFVFSMLLTAAGGLIGLAAQPAE